MSTRNAVKKVSQVRPCHHFFRTSADCSAPTSSAAAAADSKERSIGPGSPCRISRKTAQGNPRSEQGELPNPRREADGELGRDAGQ